MISYQVYKVLHILGILAIFMSLGGLTLYTANGLSKKDNKWRVAAMVTHGVGLLIVLVAGFGLLARIGTGFELWVYLKLGIWLVLGFVIALVPRFPALAKPLWFVFPLLGGLAAAIAVYKPGG